MTAAHVATEQPAVGIAAPSHVTGRFRALEHDFAVRAQDPALVRYLERLLAPMAAPGPAASAYAIDDLGPDHDRRFVIDLDGERLLRTSERSRVLSYLLWHINWAAVRASDHCVAVHAAAAEHDGTGVLLPAPMESGKTTLVAGLVRAGLRYLTDEAAAVDPETLELRAYPKPLTIDAGSWDVLDDLRPRPDPVVEHYLADQWHVPPGDIRPDAVAPTATPRLIVAPAYRPGGGTQLKRMSRSEALLVLLQNTFHLHDDGPGKLAALAALVRRCHCYRLTVDDLDRACELITELIQRVELRHNV